MSDSNKNVNCGVMFSNMQVVIIKYDEILKSSFFYGELIRSENVILQCKHIVSESAATLLTYFLQDGFSNKLDKEIIGETENEYQITYKLNSTSLTYCNTVEFKIIKECMRILDSIDIKPLLIALMSYCATNKVSYESILTEIKQDRIPLANMWVK